MDPEVKEYLVISRGQWDADASPQDVQRAIDDFYLWLERNVAQGKMRTGSRLKPEGKLVSRTSITDGPFAETKELIGGYWFILANSLDEAAQLAADNPCKVYGLSYEIRPLEPEKAVAGSVANETPTAWHLQRVEVAWRVKLPDRFLELYARLPEAGHVTLASGELWRLPFSLLEPEEIADAASVANDWEIAKGLVPIIGDFHDLVCLDYRSGKLPAVVELNDEREETRLFGTFNEFLDALVEVPDEPSDLQVVSVKLDF